MDPLTAAGLATNIVQFVEFTTKILSGARRLYTSASGAIEENQELENLTDNLRELAERTQYNASSGQHEHRSKDDIKHDVILKDLSQQCIKVADELIAVLQSLKVQGDHRAWESAYQALRTVWKQDDIESLQRRLDQISGQLNNRVSTQQQSRIDKELRVLGAENARLEANRTKEINQLKKDFTAAFEGIKRDVHEEGERTRAWSQMSSTAQKGKGYSAEQFILQSLRFYTMDYRHDTIPKEHAKTFTWIFEEYLSATSDWPSVKFVDWLKQEHGLYWVSGKPGSGKSTLMKFLSAHDKTIKHLKEWSGDQKLIVASFYFWSAGKDPLQKSQAGLLRSILYQILRQCPELIQVAFQDQWRAFMSDMPVLGSSPTEFLTTTELLAGFQRISNSLVFSRVKFCFFIDGLDEYESRPADIIRLVEVLKCSQNVKACVSSRPWNEFEANFGKDNPWKVYVHELTRDDIRLYVDDMLEKDVKFRELKETDDRCPDLVEDIVNAAKGVFLWVSLVVQSLLDGLTNSDWIVDLQRRLREIPTSLEEYFESILFTVDERYRQQTAHTFIVTLEAFDTLHLMYYWFMDQEDPDYVFKMEVKPLSTQTILSRLDQMEKRLNARCKGLLEVNWKGSTPGATFEGVLFMLSVDFLHRTVKDFLRTAQMQKLLHTWSANTFNNDLETCKAALAMVKVTATKGHLESAAPIKRAVETFFYHALSLDHDPSCDAVEVSLMEELERSIWALVNDRNRSIPLKDIIRIRLGQGHPSIQDTTLEVGMAIIVKCVQFRLTRYVARKLAEQPLLCRKEPVLLLSTALQPSLEKEDSQADLQMFQLLLCMGIDPNQRHADTSFWRRCLEVFYDDYSDTVDSSPSLPNFYYEAIKLLLRYGADAEEQCEIRIASKLTTVSATEVLRSLCREDQFTALQDLIEDQKKDRLASTAAGKIVIGKPAGIRSKLRELTRFGTSKKSKG